MSFLRDDVELLAAFRRGQRQALSKVYDHYAPEVATLIRRGFATKNPSSTRVPGISEPQDQCDLLQDTFIRAFSEKARQRYQGTSPFRCYLFAIAKNLMIDDLRRTNVRREVAGDVGDIDVIIHRNAPFVPEDPADGLHWRKQRQVTIGFMGALDPEQRRISELRFDEGWTQEETAKQLGVSRRRVRTLEAGLLKGLRRHLKFHRMWP